MTQTESESDKNRNEMHINKHSKSAKRERWLCCSAFGGVREKGGGRAEEGSQDEQ